MKRAVVLCGEALRTTALLRIELLTSIAVVLPSVLFVPEKFSGVQPRKEHV